MDKLSNIDAGQTVTVQEGKGDRFQRAPMARTKKHEYRESDEASLRSESTDLTDVTDSRGDSFVILRVLCG